MRQIQKNLLRVLYILTLCALCALPVLAGDLPETVEEPAAAVETPAPEASEEPAEVVETPAPEASEEPEEALSEEFVEIPEDALRVMPSADMEALGWDEPLDAAAGTVQNDTVEASGFVEYTTGSYGLAIIKKYEGFSEKAYSDYAQYTIGYGTNYSYAVKLYPEIAKTGKITEAQATAVLQAYLKDVEAFLNAALKSKSILVNQNQFDALVSFTYNVGSGWWTYKNDDGSWCMLRQMLEDKPANWTEKRAQTAFGSWVNAGGQRLEGLVRRRAEEAALFSQGTSQRDAQKGTGEVTGTLAGVYTDVDEGSWYYTSVLIAYQKGIMQGYGDGRFGPNDYVTRAQMVTALARFVGESAESYSGPESGFIDVPLDSWFTKPVSWASSHGVVNGIGDGKFNPHANITRQDLCCIVARYLKQIGIEAGPSKTVFADDSAIAGYAKESVYYCASLGLVNGVGNNMFDPIGVATRSQLAKILVNMLDVV